MGNASMVFNEAETRHNLIDPKLQAAGWILQDRKDMNLFAGRGIAVREFPLQTGFADYMLFVDRQAVGVVEAKAEGTPLSGVAEQSAAYLTGLPDNIPHIQLPLPFAYETNGVEVFFRNERDPAPRSRRLFNFHQPATLATWAREPETLRARLKQLPMLNTHGLWQAQTEAISNLEVSLADDKPRALIQMATGSGKTFTAVSAVYRLIKYAKVRRVLFLVDRANLGRQTLKEFQDYVTPDDGRRFADLYNVQRLTSNSIDPVNQVVITTIQRLYSMLQGEESFDPKNEEGSLFEIDSPVLNRKEPLPVVYNPAIPPETFDVIITDECHRSIYNLWRQVLEYFDGYLIGLTATPSKQTFGFFHQNLVMEYPRARAVADGVNVDGQVYRIRTQISQGGSQVEAGYYVDKRDKLTRAVRWEQLDEDYSYTPNMLDREVVSESQIRTVMRTYKEKLFSELFPGRNTVPKTLIFAKDDSHAEDIVRIAREEFGKGNEFCQKITYRIGNANPEDLIAAFRNSYNPRIAVTVDMIATGTDIKPLEVLLFMRLVKSANFFEQMLGRGTRVIKPGDLQTVTPDAERKDHFLIIDAVGVVELPKVDTQTLERKRSVPFIKLLESVTLGITDDDTLSSLASRLARLESQLSPSDEQAIEQAISSQVNLYAQRAETPPHSIRDLAHKLLDAIDPDQIEQSAFEKFATDTPTDEQLETAKAGLIEAAVFPLAANPQLRHLLVEIQRRNEQLIDRVSIDTVLEAGFTVDDALRTVNSFREYIETHKDEITALQLIYSQPYGLRQLTYQQIKELAEQLQQPPHSWTTQSLWLAYAKLEKDKVRGAGTRRVMTDLVSLVRHAVQLEDELVPFPEKVQARYEEWLAGKNYTPEQRWWLDRIVEHISVNLKIAAEDLDMNPFNEKGGRFGVLRQFGPEFSKLLDELNLVLAK
jgi:type I restriction enzyme R subunit